MTRASNLAYHKAPPSSAARYLAERIIRHLGQGDRVLWLLSGGSGATVCVEASHLLAGYDLANLFVTLSDERYGELGHKDENFALLNTLGLSLPGATLYRPLINKAPAETLHAWKAWLLDARRQADYAIVTLGVGPDAHISGVKPHSIGVTSSEAAVYFTGDDHERLTTTLSFLRQFDEAVVQAYGEPKEHVVRQLVFNTADSTDNAPMRAIYDIPKAVLFTDRSV